MSVASRAVKRNACSGAKIFFTKESLSARYTQLLLRMGRLDCSTLAVEISPLRSLTGSERYRLISPTIPRREHFCRKLSVRWVLGRDLLLGGSANGIVLLGLTIAGFLP